MYNKKLTPWMLIWMGLILALLMGCGAKGHPAEFKQTAGIRTLQRNLVTVV